MSTSYILKPADILAIRDNSLVGKIIKDATKQNYSHVSIVGRDELHVFEAAFNGVRYDTIRNKFGYFDVYRYPKITEMQVSKIIAYCSKKINLGYDYPELLSYVFHGLRKFKSSKKFICSELAYDAYLYAGIKLLDVNENQIVTPGDIASSKLLIKVNSD